MLGVARSAYDAWARCGVAARAHADLRAVSVRCARKRVARPMRAAGLVGRQRRCRVRTTVVGPAATLPPGGAPPAPNLVARDFTAPAGDRLWLGESAYGAAQEGWLYCAVLLDAHSRRVVGRAMAGHLRAELALDRLAMALQSRRHSALAYQSPVTFEEGVVLLSCPAA